MSDFSIKIREIDYNNIDGAGIDIDKGEPITKIEVSPNEEYLVIYNQKDKSIVGWNIFDTDKEKHYKIDGIKNLDKMCVSDDKKLVYIYNNKLKIIEMNNNTQEIKLYYDDENIYRHHCTFNVKGEFIICNELLNQKILRIYSTQTKNNKWMCKQIYDIPQEYELIGVLKYNKFYLLLNNCIYEWDIVTEKNVRIFADEDYEESEKRDIKISSNERFICLRIKYEKFNDEKFENERTNSKKDLKDKIIILSNELEIPIATLDINDDISLYNIMKHIDLSLYPLLLAIFDHSSEIWNSIMKYYWEVCLNHHHLSKKYRSEILSNNIQITTKYAFRVLDDDFLKIKFEEKLSLENYDKLSNEHDKTIFKGWNIYLNSDERDDVDKIKDTFKYLKILLFNPYKDILYALLREVKIFMENLFPSDYTNKYENELNHNTIKWKIRINDYKIVLQVFKKIDDSNEWSSICERIEKHNFGKGCLLGAKLIDNNDIIILTTIGLFIYYFNEYNISLTYFYYMDLGNLDMMMSQDYEKIFSEITLPLPIHDSFKLNGWVLSLADNKLGLLKYGVELLTFAIKECNLELIENIYKNCMNHFKQDLRNNRIFLSIITSTIPLLENYFSRYIERYSLETDLIIDSPSYSIDNGDGFTTFQSYLSLNIDEDGNFIIFKNPPQLVNLTRSIISKYGYRWYKNNKLLKDRSTPTGIPNVTFMVPYIKFFNYPQEYKLWSDFLFPQPSLFAKTKSKDIYKTMSGRAIIQFKWKSYGVIYYHVIFIGHEFLALSFILASVHNHENITYRVIFLWISIIFGLIHLFILLRRFIYEVFHYKHNRNFLKQISRYWLICGFLFEIFMYSFTVYTSVRLLRTSETSDIASILSFLCLFLFLKQITFIKLSNFYAIYYLIIVKVVKKLWFFFFYFIIMILLSFALAFYILLSPKLSYSLDKRIVNDDPNNPWNLTPTYQIFENETTDILNNNSFILQKPDENTNMFASFSTAIFATSLLLIGDISSLSNWSFVKKPELAVLIMLFVFLMTVFIFNVFITLYGEVNDKEKVRDSLNLMRAEILSEIELFYLLPFQRRWQKWFPDVIYFKVDIGQIEKYISNNKWNINEFPEMKQDLLNKLKIQQNYDKL